ncbi:MAG TPA: hypothetical protein VMX38_04485 [Verrucomicrobiae bacterium]|nr:hypothetical protein [Verrucomicrobiae bacterium]
MLKRTLLGMVLLGLLGMIPFIAVGQDNGNANANDQQSAPSGPEHRGRHFDPQKRTEMLTKQLKLTSDQQPKVLEVLKSEQSQMESLRSDSSLSQDDRRSKMMDIHKTSNDQIRALLDPDQQKKWDEMQSRHEQWRHHDGGQSSTAPPNS